MKGSVVSRDLTETGYRRLLNLGHTLGHALESASGFSLSHGEAVGLGTVAAAHMAGDLELTRQIRELLRKIGLPDRLPGPDLNMDLMWEYLARDKKTSSEGRTWVLPFGWEDCRLEVLDSRRESLLLNGALDFLRNS